MSDAPELQTFLFAECQRQIETILTLLDDRRQYRELLSVALRLLRDQQIEIERLRRSLRARPPEAA